MGCSCQDIQKNLVELVEQPLHPEETFHLQHCEACRLQLESYRKTSMLCKHTVIKIEHHKSEQLMVFLRQNITFISKDES